VDALNISTRHRPIGIWVVRRRLALTLRRIRRGGRRLVFVVGILRP